MPHGMIWEIVAGSFGVAAAILLVGGWVLLRYQRDRQHFQLLQTALERGITSLPGAVAGWVVSLRQGVLALVLGLGLVGSGVALRVTAGSIEPLPADANLRGAGTMPGDVQERRPVSPEDRMGPGRRADDMREGPDGPPGGPGGPGGMGGPPMRDGMRGGPPEAPAPPRLNPGMERWQRVQTQKLTGLIGICAGGILTLLGIVRIVFSSLERKYAIEAASGGGGAAAS